MKKYILIIFLISFCSNQVINEETTAVNETIVVRAELDEYREGWVEQLLSYPLLTEEEYKKSIKFLDSREPGSTIHIKVKGEDYSCIGKDSGLSINRFANEIHPINLYEDGLSKGLNFQKGEVIAISKIKVKDGTIIFPEFIFPANSAACPADVPELKATQNFEPTYFASFFSNFLISGPIAQSIFRSRTFLIFFISSPSVEILYNGIFQFILYHNFLINFIK